MLMAMTADGKKKYKYSLLFLPGKSALHLRIVNAGEIYSKFKHPISLCENQVL